MDPEAASTGAAKPPVGTQMRATAAKVTETVTRAADQVRVNPQNTPVLAWVVLVIARLFCFAAGALVFVSVAPRGLTDTHTIDGCWVDAGAYAAPEQMLECRQFPTHAGAFFVADVRTGVQAPARCLLGECGEVHQTDCDVRLRSLAACQEFLEGSKRFMGGQGSTPGAIPIPPTKCYSHADSLTAGAMFLTNYIRMYDACPDHISLKVEYITDPELRHIAGSGVASTIMLFFVLFVVGVIILLPDVLLIRVVYASIRGLWVSARTALTVPKFSDSETVAVAVETSAESGPPIVTRRRVWKEVARIVGTQIMVRLLCIGVAAGIVLWLLYSPSVDYLHTEELVVYDQCYVPSPEDGRLDFSSYPSTTGAGADPQPLYDPCTSLRLTSFSERDAVVVSDTDDLAVVVVPEGMRCRQKRCGYFMDIPCRMEWGDHDGCLRDLRSWNGSSCIARVSVNNKPAFLSADSELDQAHLDTDGAERAHPDARPCGNILHTRQPIVQFLRPHMPYNETTPILQTRRHRAHMLDELDREAVTEHLKAVGNHKSWFYHFKKKTDLQLRRLYRNDALRDTVIYTVVVVVGMILPEFVLLVTLRSMKNVDVSDRKKR